MQSRELAAAASKEANNVGNDSFAELNPFAAADVQAANSLSSQPASSNKPQMPAAETVENRRPSNPFDSVFGASIPDAVARSPTQSSNEAKSGVAQSPFNPFG